MPLPKLNAPTFSITLPLSKQKIVFRPFRVQEEKILLIAKESKDENELVRVVSEVISNCIVTPDNFNIKKLSMTDLEYLFLKLRSKSIGEIVELKVFSQNRPDLPAQKVSINLDEIEPEIPSKINKIIDIDKTKKLQLKYPTFETIMGLEAGNLNEKEKVETMFKIFIDSLDKLYDGDDTYDFEDFSDEEKEEWFNQFSSENMRGVEEFFRNMPRLRKDIEYVHINENGEKYTETIRLEGLMSFLS